MVFSAVFGCSFLDTEYRVYERRVRIGAFINSRPLHEATEACNAAMERQFCELSEFVRFQNFRPLIKSTNWSK